MKFKIEYKKRDKLRNSAIVFPIDSTNAYLMIYIYHVMNRRYKSNDYVCVYSGDSIPVSKDLLSSVFGVVVKCTEGNTIMDCIRHFITESPYRRVTFVGSECIYTNKTGSTVIYAFPEELPRRTCNTFDAVNPNVTLLTSSQRVSANRAYQTCKHTYMYVHTGKKESRGRELLQKKFETEKFAQVFDLNVDNVCALKRKMCTFDNIKTETVVDHEKLSKKIIKKFKAPESLLNMATKNMEIINKKSIGSYGYELSTKRDYSIVDKRISDQIKKNKSKIESRLKQKNNVRAKK